MRRLALPIPTPAAGVDAAGSPFVVIVGHVLDVDIDRPTNVHLAFRAEPEGVRQWRVFRNGQLWCARALSGSGGPCNGR